MKDRSQLQVQVSVPILRVAYGNIQLAASPIQADLQNGNATLHPLTIQGTDTKLSVQGAFPVGHDAPAFLDVQGAVNLQILRIFDPDLQASGQLKVNVNSHSTDIGHRLAGEIDIADASLSTDTSPVGLQHANGVLKMTNGRVEIAKFDGTLGGGEVTAQGSVDFRPAFDSTWAQRSRAQGSSIRKVSVKPSTATCALRVPQNMLLLADQSSLRICHSLLHST